MAGKRPDYRLKVLDKITENRTEVGAGWLNENGSISIKLSPCVQLTPNSNIVITLFPNNKPKSDES